jgi:small GTP-binding protein
MSSQNQNGYDMIFKIVLIGDTSVGKTNILSKYLSNEFDPDSKATVGVEFGTRDFQIENNKVKVQIWDTAGQERYRSITNAYYKGAKGSLLVYDITNPKTFENLDKWLSDLKANAEEKISVVLIGNKSDLEEERQISIEQGKEKAAFFKLAFMETSALNGNNIEKAFNELITDVYKNHHEMFEKQAKVEISDKAIDLENVKKEDKNDNKDHKKRFCCF